MALWLKAGVAERDESIIRLRGDGLFREQAFGVYEPFIK